MKENGSINRRVFSIREYSDTHGELIIGDIPSQSKEKDIPLLNLLNEESYGDIEDDQFKMGWLTKISYVLFRKESDDINYWFDAREWEFKDLFEAWIIDPAKVLRVALENAV